ncbi:MAG: acetoacetate--CoA ligase [Saprospiraceae bacterium]|nr:acetoacetate--CoA ligase [Saprospiraceae bacterium]
MSYPTPTLLWRPSTDFIANSNLNHYIRWLQQQKALQFEDYQALWAWSVEQPAAFWESVWQYFDIKTYTSYTKVLSDDPMPNARWFEGSTLNYAEHIFKHYNHHHSAFIFQSERHALIEISWADLKQQVAALSQYLRGLGVQPGDRVVAYLPNIPAATVAFLSVCAVGAVWSSCSPDFGANSVLDRFQQIEPKVFITVDGYQYNGKPFDKMDTVQELCAKLPTLEKVIIIPYLNHDVDIISISNSVIWAEALENQAAELVFEPMPFAHPIWVLYSSGTTGLPKAITHSHGGVLLEHYKYLALHNDVHPGERFFWFSTTGWMMWNFVQASLLVGATAVLYDGSPGYPNLNVLWKFTEEAKIHHFGTSAPYLVACMKAGLNPGKEFNISHLRSIGSTGSPLPPEAFDWVYQNVKSASPAASLQRPQDLWLCSMSGGTDVCTAFVGGNPLEPVYEGEIQCRALGCAMYAYDESGNIINDEVGEMVITKPMPSMPIYFWNDVNKQKYLDSYFDTYPGLWRHGDWVRITPRGTLVIYGRSDATLNRQGVRIGTSEIYSALNKVNEIKDSLIVNLELSGGKHYMPLFILLNEGQVLNNDLIKKINQTLKSEYSPRHVPDEIIEVPDIPYTISGKKMEAPVKKILLGRPIEKAANIDSMRNPESLQFFVDFAKQIEG